jgi:Leucine-rich repeat (LRR) protein
LESVSISSIIKNPLRLKSVQKLSLFDCEFDEVVVGNSFKLSDAFPNLEEVNFHESYNLWKFPADDCDLIYLKKLIVIGEYFLSALPEEIGNLVNLQVLNLRVCIYLSKLPDSIRNLKKLYFLGLDHCWAIKELPKYIGEVKSLRKLDVRSCPNLRKLPESVLDLEQLEEVICDEHSQKRWEPLLSRLKNKNSKLNIIVAYSDPLFMVET